MKKLTLTALLLTFAMAAFSQVDANNYVKIIPNQQDMGQTQLIFASPINATYTVNQLNAGKAIVNGTASIIPNERVDHFQKMVQVYNDQKAILDNWTARQNRIIKVNEQMKTYIEVQLNDMLTIKNWLEKNLGEDPDQPAPTEPPSVGQLRTVDGVLERYNGTQWVVISNPRLDIEQ